MPAITTAHAMRPLTRLYLVGMASLASLCVGFVLTADESHRTLALILSVAGALGMFACARMVKRGQS